MTRRTCIMLAAVMALAVAARAQPCGYLTVRSAAAAGLRVAVDSILVGAAPFDSLPIPSGSVVLRILPARPNAWSAPIDAETLHVLPGEHIVRDAAPLAVRRVTSEPYGAQVYAGDSLLGLTPLFLPSRFDGRLLRLAKAGYEEGLAPLSGDLHVALRSADGTARSALAAESGRSMTPVYLSAGATVIAGAAAAYCKIKADARYADYRRTGSGADLDAVRSLDRVSGISLAVSELSLFVLAYQLLSR